MAAAPLVPGSPDSPAPAPALSQGARIVDTFIAPSKTFTDLRRSAAWWAPWILISIFSMVFMYAISKQVGFDQVSRYAVPHSSRAQQFDSLPPDQQAKQLQISSKVVAGFGYGNPVLVLLFCLIGTLPLWLTFRLAFGAETTFGQAYAITIYGWLPGILTAILGTIALFAGANPEGFDVNNPVGTNLGYYLDPDTTSRFVRAIASSLDVLSFWSIVLIGIGYACTSKVKRSTAIIVVAVWFFAFKLIQAGLASM